MKKYCFDTSGISNPLELMPDDIYVSMWTKFNEFITAGKIAVTTEIYDEMEKIPSFVGDCIRSNKQLMVLEVATGTWDWPAYVRCVREIEKTHQKFISEHNGGSPKTICLNDISIVALSKALGLPLVSMEVSVMTSPNKRRIPDICQVENIEHLSFNDFLRREKIRL